jgi:hypothetical protein
MAIAVTAVPHKRTQEWSAASAKPGDAKADVDATSCASIRSGATAMGAIGDSSGPIVIAGQAPRRHMPRGISLEIDLPKIGELWVINVGNQVKTYQKSRQAV